jgi:hypothetical protein
MDERGSKEETNGLKKLEEKRAQLEHMRHGNENICPILSFIIRSVVLYAMSA